MICQVSACILPCSRSATSLDSDSSPAETGLARPHRPPTPGIIYSALGGWEHSGPGSRVAAGDSVRFPGRKRIWLTFRQSMKSRSACGWSHVRRGSVLGRWRRPAPLSTLSNRRLLLTPNTSVVSLVGGKAETQLWCGASSLLHFPGAAQQKRVIVGQRFISCRNRVGSSA